LANKAVRQLTDSLGWHWQKKTLPAEEKSVYSNIRKLFIILEKNQEYIRAANIVC
jgi:hypothetical protein